MNTAATTLKAARQELLDLGLRNPLLNFRALRSRGVEIVDERPFPIFTHLVTNEKPMGFLSTGETDENGLGQPHDARFHDNQLQTPYNDSELQKRLLATYYSAREYIEERGANTLYLALGMLHWIDRGSRDVTRRAPLILIPVELFRSTADSRFRLRSTGGDWTENRSLHTKLALDYDFNLPTPPQTDTFDISLFFEQAAQSIADSPEIATNWFIDDEAVSLGFFSFSKFLMYHDLDAANWPPDQPPSAHPLLAALLTPDGFTQSQPQLDDDAPIDSHIDLADSHQVVDADSSQTLAILDVKSGHNLIIQGPPGTGKSQTITNLIAEAHGQGKTTLFVAEKMAALDVVKRRLDEVGLGDICLELHSHKSAKRHVIGEITRVLKQGQPKENGRFPQLTTLQTIRDHLNSHNLAINTPIGDSGTTLYQAYGQQLHWQAMLAQANAALPPHWDENGGEIPQLATWSETEFDARIAATDSLQQRLTQLGVPIDHPLWGSQKTAVSADFSEALAQSAHTAQDALHQLLVAVKALAQRLETAVPTTFAALTNLTLSAFALRTAPRMYHIQTEHAAWQTMPDNLLSALKAGQQIASARENYDQWLIPEAWSQEVLALRQGLMAGRSRWKRPFSGAYRRAKAQLAGLCRTTLPPTWEEQIGAANAILDVQRAQPILNQHKAVLQPIFNIDWQYEETDWDNLVAIGEWLIDTHKKIENGRCSASLLRLVQQPIDRSALTTSNTTIAALKKQYQTTLAELHALLDFNPARLPAERKIGESFTAQQTWLTNCHAAAETINDMAAYNQQSQIMNQLHLAPLVAVADSWPAAAAQLTTLLRLARSSALVTRAVAENAVLHGYHNQHPDDTIAQFQELDTQFLHQNRLRLANEHWQQLPHYEAGGQMGLLQSECGKKRNHLPLRQLMGRAGHAIQHIKPVFMMSPLSIAAYLPPDSIQFDLVIFDEASQVRPVDAFGAILRGRQVVVVGDNRQLPPTAFFERLIDEDDAAPIGQESILDLFIARNAPQRMLRWHYRSRHESLIAVSNQAFYDQKLVVFPSPDAKKQDVGLRYHHLPSTAYERGGSRTNPLEADAVAAAVMQHAAEQPHLTLGVVAFSRGQRGMLRQRVEQLRRDNPDLESFFHAHPTEPFFVKNLENVQGDERDVILISIGYGRAADGSLTMNFGPLNQKGGERRLNVLITRARRRCAVFTNLTADDINLRRTDAEGVAALKQFLQFAQTGVMGDLPPETSSNPALFEDMLAAELRAQGLEVGQRVGSGPVRVDVAVMGKNGRYSLGIECDGDNAFIARSARDRDRIQEQVLTRLGWRIHRVWSHRWQQNPAAERQKLLTALNAPPRQTVMPAEHTFTVKRYDDRPDLAEPRPVPLYGRYTGTFDLYKRGFYHFRHHVVGGEEKLLHLIVNIVQAESPIHIEEIPRRMSHAAGYQKAGLDIQSATQLVKLGAKAGLFVVRGKFLYDVGGKRPTVRSRANITGVARKFRYIAPEEIEEAILYVVADAFSIPTDDVPLRTARLLGFHQIHGKSKTGVVEAIARLLRYGMLIEYRGDLFLNKNRRER